MTDRYAVIGNPIAHSKSPEIQAAFARQTGQDMSYERLQAPLAGFAATAMRFAREGGRGANVTVPFKLEAFALAQARSARAERAGASNTLAWRGTHWFGDNTDGVGLVRDLASTSARHLPAAISSSSARAARRAASSGPCSRRRRGRS